MDEIIHEFLLGDIRLLVVASTICYDENLSEDQVFVEAECLEFLFIMDEKEVHEEEVELTHMSSDVYSMIKTTDEAFEGVLSESATE